MSGSSGRKDPELMGQNMTLRLLGRRSLSVLFSQAVGEPTNQPREHDDWCPFCLETKVGNAKRLVQISWLLGILVQPNSDGLQARSDSILVQ